MSGNIKRFEIWWADVRFEDKPVSKRRPVLIWGETAYIVTAYKMTSRDRGDNLEEYTVVYWKEAGLPKPTYIRLASMINIKKEKLISKIGELDYRDQLRLETRLSSRLW